MLRRTVSQLKEWAGVIALFLVLAGGSAYAASAALDGPAPGQNSVGSLDIIDGQVQNADIQDSTLRGGKVKDESLAGADIMNRSLNDEDIGEAQFVNFTGQIGDVNPHDCKYGKVLGLPVNNKDHLILTAEVTTSETDLSYTPKWDASEPNDMWIQTCNPTDVVQQDGTTQFNLLVIDAQ